MLRFWGYVDWAITCTIIVPFGLFFYLIVGEELRKLFRWLLAAQIVFAVFGIVAAALGVSLAKLGAANNIVVLATVVPIGLFLVATRLRPGQRKRLTRARIEMDLRLPICAWHDAGLLYRSLLVLQETPLALTYEVAANLLN